MRVATTAVPSDRAQSWSEQPAAYKQAQQTVPKSQKNVIPIVIDREQSTSPIQVTVEEVYRRDESPDPSPPPQEAPRPAVKAVIGEILGEMVVVICQTADGEYRTRFPKSLLPKDLIALGQPVYLEIDFDSQYRSPHFRRRDPDPVETSEEFDETSEWVDGL